MTREFTGWHMLGLMVGGFGIIIAVNLTLAWNAIATFPGLETKNSYVASQHFDADRAAQDALEWDVTAKLEGGQLTLLILDVDGQAVQADIVRATLGRATTTRQDTTPEFTWNGSALVAPVSMRDGYWNLRLEAVAPDGTVFRRRFPLTAK